MPRNQKSESNTSAQLSVRCEADLKEQYKETLDEQGKSMSDDLREHMQTVVRRYGGQTDDLLPEKPKLRKGLKVLADHAYPWGDGWLVRLDEVKGEIANEANISGRVDRKVYRPLIEDGYIRLSASGIFEIDPRIVVKLRDDVEDLSTSEDTEDECAICGNSTAADDLTTTSENHPAGANVIACPNCATTNEVPAHGD